MSLNEDETVKTVLLQAELLCAERVSWLSHPVQKPRGGKSSLESRQEPLQFKSLRFKKSTLP